MGLNFLIADINTDTFTFGRGNTNGYRNKARVMPGRNVKWNGKFPEFPHFRKERQLPEVAEILEKSFRKIFFGIFGNFDRMERADLLHPLYNHLENVFLSFDDKSILLFLCLCCSDSGSLQFQPQQQSWQKWVIRQFFILILSWEEINHDSVGYVQHL